jgi:hypothetical protein
VYRKNCKGNISHRRKEDYGKKKLRSCSKTETGGKAWFLVEISEE